MMMVYAQRMSASRSVLLCIISALVLASADNSVPSVHPRTRLVSCAPADFMRLKGAGGGGASEVLRLSGGHEYDDDYEGGVPLTDVAKEALAKKSSEKKSEGASGALLSADAFRKEHDISIRKLGGGTCEQLDAVQTFGKAPFTPEILRAIRDAGFTSPSPIQAQCWPYLAAKHDLVAVAKTGSGKTCGYLLPAFMRILKACPELEKMRRGAHMPAVGRDIPREPIALILAPTRELVVQIAAESQKFGRGCNIETLGVFGGVPKGMQMRKLNMGVQVLVATPGRLNDLIQVRSARLNKIVYMVLDEADRMLDMGFEPQIKDIIKECPPTPTRHTVMFTATWPRNVQRLASTFLTNAVQVNVGNPDELSVNKDITQHLYQVEQHNKEDKLLEVMRGISSSPDRSKDSIIVFLNKKHACDHTVQVEIRKRQLSSKRKFKLIACVDDSAYV